MTTQIESYLHTVENNVSLHEPQNFEARAEAIDFIDFEIIGQLEGMLVNEGTQPSLIALLHRANTIISLLEKIDEHLFQNIREDIRGKGYRPGEFEKMVNEYVGLSQDKGLAGEQMEYDNLDIFINKLFSSQPMPEQTKDLEPEMVFYQKTPARILFDIAKTMDYNKDAIFYDLGSGLGQVAVLINLLTGIKTKGIEFEPSFCDYARQCATDLHLQHVTFINADARHTDYTDGTIFFLYTPFKGAMLQEVLDKLRERSLSGTITIITYGPCTTQVALQSWLQCKTLPNDNIYTPAIFTSV